MTTGLQIQKEAMWILGESSLGASFTELVCGVKAAGFSERTASREIPTLPRSGEVYHPRSYARYRLLKFKIGESFCRHLVQEMEECSKAICLGRDEFDGKWGAPTVIGTGPARFPRQIISAEITSDSEQLITAFGQACTYLLFSHKSYLMIPDSSTPTNIQRLESLCQNSGIGLITFKGTPKSPVFSVRTHAQKHRPRFYVTKFLKDEFANRLRA